MVQHGRVHLPEALRLPVRLLRRRQPHEPLFHLQLRKRLLNRQHPCGALVRLKPMDTADGRRGCPSHRQHQLDLYGSHRLLQRVWAPPDIRKVVAGNPAPRPCGCPAGRQLYNGQLRNLFRHGAATTLHPGLLLRPLRPGSPAWGAGLPAEPRFNTARDSVRATRIPDGLGQAGDPQRLHK